jgi:hypothetical protein
MKTKKLKKLMVIVAIFLGFVMVAFDECIEGNPDIPRSEILIKSEEPQRVELENEEEEQKTTNKFVTNF